MLFLGSLDASHLKREPTDVGSLLTSRLATYQLAAHKKDMALALDLPPQVVKANLNANIFGRVIDNLMSNALKFTPPGGRITLGLQKRSRAGRY